MRVNAPLALSAALAALIPAAIWILLVSTSPVQSQPVHAPQAAVTLAPIVVHPSAAEWAAAQRGG